MDLAEQRAEGAGARYSSAECSWAFTPSFDSVIQFNGWERRNSLDSHTLDRGITFPGMGRFFSHYQSGICSLENRLPIMALYGSFAPQTEYPCQRTQDHSSGAECVTSLWSRGSKCWHGFRKAQAGWKPDIAFSDPVSWIRAALTLFWERHKMPPAHLNFFTLSEDLKVLFLTP